MKPDERQEMSWANLSVSQCIVGKKAGSSLLADAISGTDLHY